MEIDRAVRFAAHVVAQNQGAVYRQAGAGGNVMYGSAAIGGVAEQRVFGGVGHGVGSGAVGKRRPYFTRSGGGLLRSTGQKRPKPGSALGRSGLLE